MVSSKEIKENVVARINDPSYLNRVVLGLEEFVGKCEKDGEVDFFKLSILMSDLHSEMDIRNNYMEISEREKLILIVAQFITKPELKEKMSILGLTKVFDALASLLAPKVPFLRYKSERKVKEIIPFAIVKQYLIDIHFINVEKFQTEKASREILAQNYMQLLELIQSLSYYYADDETMFDEIKNECSDALDGFCAGDETKDIFFAQYILNLFLPVLHTKPQTVESTEAPEDFERKSKKLFDLLDKVLNKWWPLISNSKDWDSGWLRLLAAMLEDNVNSTISQMVTEPQMLHFLFSKIQQSLSLSPQSSLFAFPRKLSLPKSEIAISGKLTALLVTISYTGQQPMASPVAIFKRMLQSMSTLFHPSNASQKSTVLCAFLAAIANKLNLVDTSVSAETKFVIITEIFDKSLLLLASKGDRVSLGACQIISQLAYAAPKLIFSRVDQLIMEFLSDKTAATKVHLAPAAINLLSALVEPFSISSDLMVFLLRSVERTVGGLDGNDVQKTLSTLKLYINMLKFIPVIDDSSGQFVYERNLSDGALSRSKGYRDAVEKIGVDKYFESKLNNGGLYFGDESEIFARESEAGPNLNELLEKVLDNLLVLFESQEETVKVGISAFLHKAKKTLIDDLSKLLFSQCNSQVQRKLERKVISFILRDVYDNAAPYVKGLVREMFLASFDKGNLIETLVKPILKSLITGKISERKKGWFADCLNGLLSVGGDHLLEISQELDNLIHQSFIESELDTEQNKASLEKEKSAQQSNSLGKKVLAGILENLALVNGQQNVVISYNFFVSKSKNKSKEKVEWGKSIPFDLQFSHLNEEAFVSCGDDSQMFFKTLYDKYLKLSLERLQNLLQDEVSAKTLKKWKLNLSILLTILDSVFIEDSSAILPKLEDYAKFILGNFNDANVEEIILKLIFAISRRNDSNAFSFEADDSKFAFGSFSFNLSNMDMSKMLNSTRGNLFFERQQRLQILQHEANNSVSSETLRAMSKFDLIETLKDKVKDSKKRESATDFSAEVANRTMYLLKMFLKSHNERNRSNSLKLVVSVLKMFETSFVADVELHSIWAKELEELLLLSSLTNSTKGLSEMEAFNSHIASFKAMDDSAKLFYDCTMQNSALCGKIIGLIFDADFSVLGNEKRMQVQQNLSTLLTKFLSCWDTLLNHGTSRNSNYDLVRKLVMNSDKISNVLDNKLFIATLITIIRQKPSKEVFIDVAKSLIKFLDKSQPVNVRQSSFYALNTLLLLTMQGEDGEVGAFISEIKPLFTVEALDNITALMIASHETKARAKAVNQATSENKVTKKLLDFGRTNLFHDGYSDFDKSLLPVSLKGLNGNNILGLLLMFNALGEDLLFSVGMKLVEQHVSTFKTSDTSNWSIEREAINSFVIDFLAASLRFGALHEMPTSHLDVLTDNFIIMAKYNGPEVGKSLSAAVDFAFCGYKSIQKSKFFADKLLSEFMQEGKLASSQLAQPNFLINVLSCFDSVLLNVPLQDQDSDHLANIISTLSAGNVLTDCLSSGTKQLREVCGNFLATLVYKLDVHSSNKPPRFHQIDDILSKFIVLSQKQESQNFDKFEGIENFSLLLSKLSLTSDNKEELFKLLEKLVPSLLKSTMVTGKSDVSKKKSESYLPTVLNNIDCFPANYKLHLNLATNLVEYLSDDLFAKAQKTLVISLNRYFAKQSLNLLTEDFRVFQASVENALMQDFEFEVQERLIELLRNVLSNQKASDPSIQDLVNRLTNNKLANRDKSSVRNRSLLLMSVVQAFPYEVSEATASAVATLARLSRNKDERYKAAAKKTVEDFRRTHHDNWDKDKLKFTPGMLDDLSYTGGLVGYA